MSDSLLHIFPFNRNQSPIEVNIWSVASSSTTHSREINSRHLQWDVFIMTTVVLIMTAVVFIKTAVKIRVFVLDTVPYLGFINCVNKFC